MRLKSAHAIALWCDTTSRIKYFIVFNMQITHIVPFHPVFNSMSHFWLESFPCYETEINIMKPQFETAVYEASHSNIKIVEFSSRKDLAEVIIEKVRSADLVVFHSLFFDPIVKVRLIYAGIYKYMYKLTWIEWGFDLYYKDLSSIKNRLQSTLRRMSVRLFDSRIPYFVAIHPCDIASYKKIIGGNALLQFAPYTSTQGLPSYVIDHTKVSMKNKRERNSPIIIQVGHRADHIIDHFDTLKSLLRFKDENILLYVPLSYGDKSYAIAVEEYAKKEFGDKVFCQMETIPYDEYVKHLKDVDIFILNSERQIALGNLNPMIAMGKKIVLPKNSVMYNYFNESSPIFKYEDLKTCSFLELIEDVDMHKAQENMIAYKNIDPTTQWSKVFNRIIKNIEIK